MFLLPSMAQLFRDANPGPAIHGRALPDARAGGA
jgi:hypothetical protein